MQPKTASRLAWGLWGFMCLLAVAGILTVRATRGSLGDDLFIAPVVVILAGVGALIASRRPGNAIGWLLITAASGAVIGFFLGEFTIYAVTRDLGPRWLVDILAGIGNFSWLATFGLLPTFLLLLFPDGRLPSPRWRPVGWGVAGVIGLTTLATALKPGPVDLDRVDVVNPFGIEALRDVITVAQSVLYPLFFLASVVCLAGLVVRFRRSRGEERLQVRWFLWAAALAVLSFTLGNFLPPVASEIVFWLSIVGLAGAIAVGVLKYRLYEIDLVIRKALVYGALAAVVTAIYLLLVVGIPAALLGTEFRDQSLIVIVGTAALTLTLSPVRRRAARLANRLVYGQRATPYEVMSEFAERLGEGYSMDDVLPRMARILGEGTGAERAEVLLGAAAGRELAAGWPADSTPGTPDVVVPVAHQGEELGALAVRKPRGEPITHGEEKLVRDLAAQAGLVLRNVRLLEDVRASRKRLVAAQDEERRRLERDIHDGAQQQLVALAVKLRLLETLTEKDPARAKSMASELKAEATDALENLRDLARGIYPPLLADEGLAAALTSQARKSPLPVEVHPDGVARYPQEIEAAVYFCVLEALQNVAKYADATRAEVRLSARERELRFEVADDGRGFDAATARSGSGTRNMADRLEALGGELQIRSAPGEGTTVAGRVPVGDPR
jgi:signal transduction histidine kinase